MVQCEQQRPSTRWRKEYLTKRESATAEALCRYADYVRTAQESGEGSRDWVDDRAPADKPVMSQATLDCAPPDKPAVSQATLDCAPADKPAVRQATLREREPSPDPAVCRYAQRLGTAAEPGEGFGVGAADRVPGDKPVVRQAMLHRAPADKATLDHVPADKPVERQATLDHLPADKPVVRPATLDRVPADKVDTQAQAQVSECEVPSEIDKAPHAEEQDWEPEYRRTEYFHGTFSYAGSLNSTPALAMYDTRDEVCLRVGGFRHRQVVRDRAGGEFIVVGAKPIEGKTHLWFQPDDLARSGAGAYQGVSVEELRRMFSIVSNMKGKKLRRIDPGTFDSMEDPDGERICLCSFCRLPLGKVGPWIIGTDIVHAECLAQIELRHARAESNRRRREAMQQKKALAAEYEIGWGPEHIPHSPALAQELTGSPRFGLYCLVLDEEGSARVAPTTEPAAAVNLEYLAVALQVRVLDGREPFFSLDPVDPADPDSMLEKRFEPSWLAGTRVGEVLFQADYHLKELSVGSCAQPVVGMRSCVDGSDEEGKAWNAREWFVVKDAQVSRSSDGALVPSLTMGVEAREQILGPNGMENIKVAKRSHPLVKYANAFTERFDLIAERKSVIHKLRELAKASVLAKFLLDRDVQLEDAWFNFEPAQSSACSLEVPQLWNERCSSPLKAEDGKLIAAGKVKVGSRNVRGVYGGVEFGIDKFDLSQPTQHWRLRSAVPAAPLPAPVSAAAPVLATLRRRTARAAPTARGEEAVTARFSQRVGAARGVDLNLEEFILSDPEQAGARALGSPAPLGEAFWASLDGEGASALKAEDATLLRQVFQAELSDRRTEGELFVPPEASPRYMEALRRLVAAEREAKEARKEYFLSASFSESNPGPLFPASWASAAEEKAHPSAQLRIRADCKAASPVFDKALKSATPVFDKATEDGARYRIYRFGSTEVRTTREGTGEETIGEIFSTCMPKKKPVMDEGGQLMVKVTECVEEGPDGGRHSYALLETTSGHKALTEMKEDGNVAWEDDPQIVEARSSLGKVIRAASCESTGLSRAGISAEAFRRHCLSQDSGLRSLQQGVGHPCERKQYGQIIFCLATDANSSGFRHVDRPHKWKLRPDSWTSNEEV